MESQLRQVFDPDTLVDEYADLLFRFALLHVRDRFLAEDMVQETFLAALKGYRSFSGHSSLKTWLCGILKHKIVDHFRKTQRHAQFVPNQFGEIEDEAWMRFAAISARAKFSPAPDADPQTQIEQKAFWRFLEKSLAQLNSRMATAFTLREIEHLSTKDVCQRMQISESNLWVMLHRARRHLRECFQGNWGK